MADNIRIRGEAPASLNYEVLVQKPFDARTLVPSYSCLTDKANWLKLGTTNQSIAYNGMIVAVANLDNPSENGIYYLFDVEATGRKSPNVEDETNWHKVGESDISEADLASAIEKLKTELDTIYVKNDDAFAALKQASIDNADAIKALVGDDINQSIRQISTDAAQDEISRQVVTPNTALGGLVLRIGNNEEAIRALQQTGGVSPEDVYAILKNTSADALVDTSDEIKVNGRQLEINRVGVSKLYEDVNLILHGGSARIEGE